MESSEAVKFVVEELGVEDAEVLDVKEGFHNRNFIVKTSSRNLVVREQIGNPLGSKGLENEKTILKFMEYRGLESMPRSVFYSGEEEIHVIEFLEGSEQLVEEIDENKWVEELLKFHKLSFNDYRDFCKKQDYRIGELSTPEKRLEKLKSETENLEVTEFREWLEKEINHVKNNLNFNTSPEPGLAHGDIANSTFTSGNKIYFIDWEFAEFRERPESDLADLFIGENISKQQQDKMIEKYRKLSNRGKGIEKDIRELKKIIYLSRITWGLKQGDKTDFCKKQKEKYEGLF